ncbi:MAG: hypothetical protein LQ343_002850 [Gyalolechia ehrenbergii]|nr:MAG: hypothetical protein LQ343_002850 [Gyalolechia ehrenbergii]
MPPHPTTTTRFAPAAHGSATQLETTPLPPPLQPTLRLRADSTNGRRLRWAEDVIDNEGMGKKKSKGVFPYLKSRSVPTQKQGESLLTWMDTVCCIYHPTRAVGESSSENDSGSSSSDSDSDPDSSSPKNDDGRARMSGTRRKRKRMGERQAQHNHNHNDDRECGEEGSHGSKPARGKRKGKNAYETQPKSGGGEGKMKA